MPNTICLSNNAHYIRKEIKAAGAITPGDLVERDGSGTVVVHSTADAPSQRFFAVENDLAGEGIDTAYASGDLVQIVRPAPGAKVYAWLKDGQAVQDGDALISAGDGTLEAFVDASHEQGAIVAWAAEDVTASGADARITVEVA